MLIVRDLYTQVDHSPIESSGIVLGQTIIQYEVRAYTDVRNLKETKAYIVTCTQRLVLPNPNAYVPEAVGTTGFINYPALLSNNIAISDPDGLFQTVILLDYAPRTLNTAVVSSQSSDRSTGATVSQQYTSGSSTAQTNSYSISVSAGFFGELPTGDISTSQERSKTRERSSSFGRENAINRGTQLSNATSMTIKDWGSYASVDLLNTSPTWVWGQEFPWNVIQLKNTDANHNIVLPAQVITRLYDGAQVYPPSELSLFGLDFVCKASWVITPKVGNATPERVIFKHALSYGAASHAIVDRELRANLTTYQPVTYTSQVLDLAVLGLDAISSGTDSTAAVIGFIPNRFDVPPTSSGSPFSITGESNNLLVRGSGFTGIMSTDFSAGTVRMDICFKIVDSMSDVVLSFKHWVLNSAACRLTIVVNGNSDITITKFVDAPEAGSGGDNVMVIALRDKNVASVDYCDYLQLGLNTISVTFSPVDTGVKTVYQILAMAIA